MRLPELTETELAEIEAIYAYLPEPSELEELIGTGERARVVSRLLREDIPALCRSLRAARAEIARLTTQWCECGHAKGKHGFFSDHDECYECDQASPDLCCEWRPAPRQVERDETAALRAQLAQVEQDRDAQVRQAELSQERLQTAVQLALQGLHERCCEVAALQWFQHEYVHAVRQVRDADETTVFALRKGLPTLTGSKLENL